MVDQLGNWRPDYPGQQPYMDPQFVRLYGPTQQQTTPQPQQQQASQAMTPPTIHAEIIQVSAGERGEQEASQYPLGVGQSQMFMAQDDSVIYIKTAAGNGHILNVFPKRPPAPKPPPFNPDEYVRLEALPGLVAAEVQAAVAAMQPAKAARPKKETEAAE